MTYLTASKKYGLCDMFNPESYLAIQRDLTREVLGVGGDNA